jgi:hypothetical protein
MSNIEKFTSLAKPNPDNVGAITQCADSRTGELFFKSVEGIPMSGLAILRYANHDVIVVIGSDDSMLGIVGTKDAFIAVEFKDPDPQKSGNLAFRDDISHQRLNLALSFDAREDVTYQDPSFVNGETIPLDPTAQFTQLLLNSEANIKNITPSWWTEDWITLNNQNGGRLVIRADRNSIRGAIKLQPSGVEYMNIGDSAIETIALDQPTNEPIPLKYIPPQV